MKVRWSRHFTSRIKGDGPKHSYYVEFYTQPFGDALVAWLYHRVWERATKPLLFKLERFDPRRNREDDFHIPFTNAQDIRCHDLSRRNRVTVADVEVTKDTYDSIGKAGPW